MMTVASGIESFVALSNTLPTIEPERGCSGTGDENATDVSTRATAKHCKPRLLNRGLMEYYDERVEIKKLILKTV
jgi:hypothetical protein